MKNRFFSEKLLLFLEGKPEGSAESTERGHDFRSERMDLAESLAAKLVEPRITMEGEKMKIKGFDGTFEREDGKDGKVGHLIYKNPKLEDENVYSRSSKNDQFLINRFPGQTEFRLPLELMGRQMFDGTRYQSTWYVDRWYPIGNRVSVDATNDDGIKLFDGTFDTRGDMFIYTNSRLGESNYQPKAGSCDEWLKFAYPGIVKFKTFSNSIAGTTDLYGMQSIIYMFLPMDVDGMPYKGKDGTYHHHEGYVTYDNPKLGEESYIPKQNLDSYLRNKFPGETEFRSRFPLDDRKDTYDIPPSSWEPLWGPEDEVKNTSTTISDKVQGIWTNITGKEEEPEPLFTPLPNPKQEKNKITPQ